MLVRPDLIGLDAPLMASGGEVAIENPAEVAISKEYLMKVITSFRIKTPYTYLSLAVTKQRCYVFRIIFKKNVLTTSLFTSSYRPHRKGILRLRKLKIDAKV